MMGFSLSCFSYWTSSLVLVSCMLLSYAPFWKGVMLKLFLHVHHWLSCCILLKDAPFLNSSSCILDIILGPEDITPVFSCICSFHNTGILVWDHLGSACYSILIRCALSECVGCTSDIKLHLRENTGITPCAHLRIVHSIERCIC